MTTSHYFLSPADRKPGHVFAAGNHGKVMRGYRHFTGDMQNGWKLAIEYMLETVRMRDANDKPSRWDAAFAFVTQADALSRRHLFDPNCRLYEVEFVDPKAPWHIADFDLYTTICTSVPRLPFVPKSENMAKQYWNGQINGVREILSLSDMRIVKRVV